MQDLLPPKATDLLTLAVERGVMTLLAELRKSQRLSVTKAVTSEEHRTVHLSSTARRNLNDTVSLLDSWHLSSGKRLGDATKEDLVSEAVAAEARAGGELRRAMFCRAVARKTVEGRTVSSCLSANEVALLFGKANAQ